MFINLFGVNLKVSGRVGLHTYILRDKEARGSTRLALYCIVDSAFKAEEPDCLALRADVLALGPAPEGPDGGVYGGNIHMLVTTSKKQTRVNRNTFSAEANAVGDSASGGIVLAGLLHEVFNGATMECPSLSISDLYQKCDPAGCGIKVYLPF